MDIRERRLEIFQLVEKGVLSLEEASLRLEELEKNGYMPDAQLPPQEIQAVRPEHSLATDSTTTRAEPVVIVKPAPATTEEEKPPVFWRGWWLLVFIMGLILALASANWMTQGVLAAGLSWGFWLSFIPFLLGVFIMWLGWEIHLARWLYVHIRQRPGAHPEELVFAFPLPTGLISWAIRRFGHFASRVPGRHVADFLDEMDHAVATDGPVHIQVGDQHGERVEVWIDGPHQ